MGEIHPAARAEGLDISRSVPSRLPLVERPGGGTLSACLDLEGTSHHRAAGDLVTDLPLLTFVLWPCLTTAGLLGRAGVWRTIGRRVPFGPLNFADRRSLAAVRLRGVVRRSMRPADRILVPNRVLATWARLTLRA